MKHESCQNSVKNMKHCGLPPHPPLQIKRKIRKGSKQTKLKQNHTHDLIKARKTMKTHNENILAFRKPVIYNLFPRLKNQEDSVKLNKVTIAPFFFRRSRLYDSVTKHLQKQNLIFFFVAIKNVWRGIFRLKDTKQKRENGSVSNY